MNIVFRTSRLKKIFNCEKELVKTYGAKKASKIRLRVAFLNAAPCLEAVPIMPPHRRHQLKGKYEGCFAVSIDQQYRLIFRPITNPLPLLDDGGLDLTRVTEIEIIDVKDYH